MLTSYMGCDYSHCQNRYISREIGSQQKVDLQEKENHQKVGSNKHVVVLTKTDRRNAENHTVHSERREE